MNLTLHIVKKDFRRLLVPLVLWALLLVAQILIGVRLLRGDGDNLEWFGRMGLYGQLFFALDLLVSYVLVASLIHEDPVMGSRMFWLTRPISGARLLGAKLLAVALMFGVLPLLIWLPWWLACGYGWHDVAAAAYETLVWKTMVVVPALLLAILTDHFSRYLVWTLAMILVLALAGAVVSASLPLLPQWQAGGLGETRVRLALFVIVTDAAVVVGHQFITRQIVRSFVIGGAGLVLAALVVILWPWNLSRLGSGRVAPTSATADHVSISLDQIRIDFPRANAQSRPEAMLALRMTAHGVPDGLGLVGYWSRSDFRSDYAWRWPDGTMLELNGQTGFSYFEDWMDGAVRSLLGVPALKPDSRRNELILAHQQKLREGQPLWEFLSLPIPMAERMAKAPPAYDSKLNLLLVRPELEYELPLRESDRQRHGTTSLRIAKAAIREDGRMFVNLVESKPDPRTAGSYTLTALDPKKYTLLNRNRTEAEFILGYGSNQTTRIGTVEIRWNTLAFPPPLEQRAGGKVSEPSTWFDGTTLVRVGFVEESRISREVKLDRFEETPP